MEEQRSPFKVYERGQSFATEKPRWQYTVTEPEPERSRASPLYENAPLYEGTAVYEEAQPVYEPAPEAETYVEGPTFVQRGMAPVIESSRATERTVMTAGAESRPGPVRGTVTRTVERLPVREIPYEATTTRTTTAAAPVAVAVASKPVTAVREMAPVQETRYMTVSSEETGRESVPVAREVMTPPLIVSQTSQPTLFETIEVNGSTYKYAGVRKDGKLAYELVVPSFMSKMRSWTRRYMAGPEFTAGGVFLSPFQRLGKTVGDGFESSYPGTAEKFRRFRKQAFGPAAGRPYVPDAGHAYMDVPRDLRPYFVATPQETETVLTSAPPTTAYTRGATGAPSYTYARGTTGTRATTAPAPTISTRATDEVMGPGLAGTSYLGDRTMRMEAAMPSSDRDRGMRVGGGISSATTYGGERTTAQRVEGATAGRVHTVVAAQPAQRTSASAFVETRAAAPRQTYTTTRTQTAGRRGEHIKVVGVPVYVDVPIYREVEKPTETVVETVRRVEVPALPKTKWIERVEQVPVPLGVPSVMSSARTTRAAPLPQQMPSGRLRYDLGQTYPTPHTQRTMERERLVGVPVYIERPVEHIIEKPVHRTREVQRIVEVPVAARREANVAERVVRVPVPEQVYYEPTPARLVREPVAGREPVSRRAAVAAY